LTTWAHSLHFDGVTDDGVVRGLLRLFLDQAVDRHRKVADPATANAADVVMLTGIPVEPNRFVRASDFANQSFVDQGPEVR
jgi:hypothetical protein